MKHKIAINLDKCFSTIHLFRKSFYCTCSGTFEKINMFILPTLMYYELIMIYSSFCKKPDKSSNAQTEIKNTITILLSSDVDMKEKVFLLKSEKSIWFMNYTDQSICFNFTIHFICALLVLDEKLENT